MSSVAMLENIGVVQKRLSEAAIEGRPDSADGQKLRRGGMGGGRGSANRLKMEAAAR